MRYFNTKDCSYDSKDNNIDSKSGKSRLGKKFQKRFLLLNVLTSEFNIIYNIITYDM